MQIIASPKAEANNRIRRKKTHVTLSVCLYVCNAPQLEQFTSDFRFFGLKNYTKFFRCDQNKKKINSLNSFFVINKKLLKTRGRHCWWPLLGVTITFHLSWKFHFPQQLPSFQILTQSCHFNIRPMINLICDSNSLIYFT